MPRTSASSYSIAGSSTGSINGEKGSWIGSGAGSNSGGGGSSNNNPPRIRGGREDHSSATVFTLADSTTVSGVSGAVTAATTTGPAHFYASSQQQQQQPRDQGSVATWTTGTSCGTSFHNPPEEPLIPIHRPKGMLNVGNTCYANAVLQCLLSTALTQALLDPRAGAIFRKYASNPNLLEEQPPSSSSAAGAAVPTTTNSQQPLHSREEDDEEEPPSPQNENDTTLRIGGGRRPRPDRQLRDKCKWLTRELRAITTEYLSCQNFPDDDYWLAIVRAMSWSNGPVVDPGSITKHPDRLSPCLRPYQQEDAHEFMRALLSTLVMNGQNRRLSSLFDGLLESSVTCLQCGKPSLTRDRYMDLSLDIHQGYIKTLTDALAEFTAEETLDGDNSVHCRHCRGKKTAAKCLRLATAPSIFVCHLKRFALDSYGRPARIHKHVHFPERLHIGSYMSKVNQSRPPPYDLVALLVHQGRTCDSGHYVAYCKHAGEWFQCNDSLVEKVSVQKVLEQQAYILLYEVADMRSNHGYPSPHTKWEENNNNKTASSRSSFSSSASHKDATTRTASIERLLSQLSCGFDDRLLRDFCCFDAAAAAAVRRQQHRRRRQSSPLTHDLFRQHRHRVPAPKARDDSTLEGSVTTTSSTIRTTGTPPNGWWEGLEWRGTVTAPGPSSTTATPSTQRLRRSNSSGTLRRRRHRRRPNSPSMERSTDVRRQAEKYSTIIL